MVNPLCLYFMQSICLCVCPCRVKGGQELVAAIQAAKQARLKVSTLLFSCVATQKHQSSWVTKGGLRLSFASQSRQSM
jgi:hypothetical protein